MNKESNLYSLVDGNYVEDGKIGNAVELTLEDMPEITLEDKYF